MADVELGIKITGNSSQAKQAINEVTEAFTKLTTPIGENNQVLKNLKDNFAQIVVGIGGAAMATKSLVGPFLESEKANIMLANAMKQAGTYTKEAYERNLSYAESLKALTSVDDDQIVKVQTMLAQFGVQGEMLDKLTLSTLNLSERMGKDLVAASQAVANYVNGSSNSINRMDVAGDHAAGSINRMEDALKALAPMTDAATESAKSNAGQMEATAIAVGDAQEALGESLMPVVSVMASGIKFLSQAIGGMPPVLKTATSAAIILVPALIALNAAAGPLGITLGLVAGVGIAIAGAAQKAKDAEKEYIENGKKVYDLKTEQFTLNKLIQRGLEAEFQLQSEKNPEMIASLKAQIESINEKIKAKKDELATHEKVVSSETVAARKEREKNESEVKKSLQTINDMHKKASMDAMAAEIFDVGTKHKELAQKASGNAKLLASIEVAKQEEISDIQKKYAAENNKKFIEDVKIAADAAISAMQSIFSSITALTGYALDETLKGIESEKQARLDANIYSKELKAIDEAEEKRTTDEKRTSLDKALADAKKKKDKTAIEDAKRDIDEFNREQILKKQKADLEAKEKSETERINAEATAKANAEKKKKAETDKAFSITMGVINTALAVVKALAEGGPYLGPILAGISAAAGAAQVAVIAAQPIPYADGGIISEPIFGVGASGKTYTFGEREAEMITPMSKINNSQGSGGDNGVHFHFHGDFNFNGSGEKEIKEFLEKMERLTGAKIFRR